MPTDSLPTRRSVVITGVGVVSPLGMGAETHWSGLLAGRSGVRRIQHFDPTGLPVEFGGEVPGFDPKQHIRPRKSLKVMSREIQFAFTAAEMALHDAGLQVGQFPPERLGVVFGADMIYGELPDMQDAVSVSRDPASGKFDIHRWADLGMQKIFPLWLLKYLPNMPACHVAIANDARASCNSIILGEVSALVALAEGVRLIERGLAEMVIVGGVGHQINPTNIAFRANQELSKRAADPENACRPFDCKSLRLGLWRRFRSVHHRSRGTRTQTRSQEPWPHRQLCHSPRTEQAGCDRASAPRCVACWKAVCGKRPSSRASWHTSTRMPLARMKSMWSKPEPSPPSRAKSRSWRSKGRRAIARPAAGRWNLQRRSNRWKQA